MRLGIAASVLGARPRPSPFEARKSSRLRVTGQNQGAAQDLHAFRVTGCDLVSSKYALVCREEAAMADNGLVTVKSAHGVKDTIDRLAADVTAKGMRVFARIDHAQGANEVGLALRPTELLIFGNAKGGTPLMQSRQTIGIDLTPTARSGSVITILPGLPRAMGRRAAMSPRPWRPRLPRRRTMLRLADIAATPPTGPPCTSSSPARPE
jgi:hypothetical protein